MCDKVEYVTDANGVTWEQWNWPKTRFCKYCNKRHLLTSKYYWFRLEKRNGFTYIDSCKKQAYDIKRKWHFKNLAKMQKYKLEYFRKNKKKLMNYAKNWKQTNKEIVKEYDKIYNETYKEEISKRAKLKRDSLSDDFVKNYLAKRFEGIYSKDITDEMMEHEKARLKLLRLYNKLKENNTNINEKELRS